jgi:hypothetical protein
MWLGGLIAPLAAPLALFCVVLIVSLVKEGPAAGMHDWAQGLSLVTLFTLPVSYLATWVLGLPYILWLRSSVRLSKWNVCLGAVGIGVVSAFIWQFFFKVGALLVEQMAFGALLSAGLALCVAWTFCWIVGVPTTPSLPG